MSEHQNPDTDKQKVFNLEDTTVETVYANTTHIIVGEGDVTIHFGFQQIEGNNIPATNVKRIVLTHDSFMRMMEFWAGRYRLLETLYQGKPNTLRDVDRDVVKTEFDRMLGKISLEDIEDEPNIVSANPAKPTGPSANIE